MYKILVVALFAACTVNVCCLCGHLSGMSGPASSSAAASPMRIASSLESQ